MASPGQHCHSALSLTAVDQHSFWIYTVILLSSLSFSAKIKVLARGIYQLFGSKTGLQHKKGDGKLEGLELS
jgi:hypothetical protein